MAVNAYIYINLFMQLSLALLEMPPVLQLLGSQNFMNSEGSLPSTQESSTGVDSQLHQSSLYHSTSL
jgi:hypothetical protein